MVTKLNGGRGDSCKKKKREREKKIHASCLANEAIPFPKKGRNRMNYENKIQATGEDFKMDSSTLTGVHGVPDLFFYRFICSLPPGCKCTHVSHFL